MEAILVHPENLDQLKAVKAVLKALKVPFEEQKEISSPTLTKADIDRAYNEVRANQYTTVDIDDLWK